ncbi:MAG: preprotein translocase subunit SecG [Coxiella sp. RIFCSPHIGHO2_12_FULL_42_15]|nr:MAG: preprotein translocase subunit SecG [Coxiella sp. RIFCSPHIGHO2_12_FULL_42_15]
MQPFILVIHVLIAIALISLVLVQHGKGADLGASLGSGAANTMFGSVGPASFLMKLTSILGLFFFATSISLGLLAVKQTRQNSMDFMNQPNAAPMTTAPALPAPTQEDPFSGGVTPD